MRLPRALLVALGLLLLAAAPAHAARGMEVAISDEDAMVDGRDGDPLAAYKAAQALNATRMRIVVQWARVSDAASTTPSPNPDYNWGPIDNAVDAAAAYGMRTQLVLAGPAPAYAAGLAGKDPKVRVKRPKPQLYANFARAAAEHFKGRVDRYSIWNEPNFPAWIAPQKESPKIYRALYEAGYNAIKSVDPTAQVLIGETVPYGGKVSRKVRAWRRRRWPGCAPSPASTPTTSGSGTARRSRPTGTATTRTSSRCRPPRARSPAPTTRRSRRWAACEWR
jgi:Cellulase (glycosyl hydrolase family 5)